MAIVKDNIITKSLSGRIGNLIFRQRNGKTIVYSLPRSYPPPTPLQESRRLLFASAVVQARQAIRDTLHRDFFKRLAKKGQSTYHAALSYFLKKGNAPQPGIKLPSKQKLRPNQQPKTIRPHLIDVPTSLINQNSYTAFITHEMLLRQGFP